MDFIGRLSLTSADENPSMDSAKPVAPKIKEIRVEKVSALTDPDSPTDMKDLDVCGTDLGTMTEIGNRIFFAFGDTFGYEGDICRGVCGPNCRSNVLLARPSTIPQAEWF